jgi:hypothetical protein
MMNSLRSKVAVTMALALAVTLVAVSPAGAHPGPWPAKKPTVVLVHGAFADSSGFSGIVERLQAAGYPVVAAANPLRSLAADAASIRALLDTVDGPIILVAHSYGGNVISAAATGGLSLEIEEDLEGARFVCDRWIFPLYTLDLDLQEVTVAGRHVARERRLAAEWGYTEEVDY